MKGKKSSVWFEEGKNNGGNRLEKYVDALKAKLVGEVPTRHAHRPEIYKDMIQRDLDYTLKKIAGN